MSSDQRLRPDGTHAANAGTRPTTRFVIDARHHPPTITTLPAVHVTRQGPGRTQVSTPGGPVRVAAATATVAAALLFTAAAGWWFSDGPRASDPAAPLGLAAMLGGGVALARIRRWRQR